MLEPVVRLLVRKSGQPLADGETISVPSEPTPIPLTVPPYTHVDHHAAAADHYGHASAGTPDTNCNIRPHAVPRANGY